MKQCAMERRGKLRASIDCHDRDLVTLKLFEHGRSGSITAEEPNRSAVGFSLPLRK